MHQPSQDRHAEREAVRTTIVGGRPPGSGKDLGPIPRGIEVLVKKASVDPTFKALLLETRAAAAREIGLDLAPAEVQMLGAVPAAQLEAIIANTKVSEISRAAFLGRAASAMIAALGAGLAAGCDRTGRPRPTAGTPPDRVSEGIRPERVQKEEVKPEPPPEKVPVTDGIRPDRVRPEENTPQQEPEEPIMTKGIRPDRPPQKDEAGS